VAAPDVDSLPMDWQVTIEWLDADQKVIHRTALPVNPEGVAQLVEPRPQDAAGYRFVGSLGDAKVELLDVDGRPIGGLGGG